MANEPIILTGVVYGYESNPNAPRPKRGDCKIEPPHNTANYVSASVFDGVRWRKLFIPDVPGFREKEIQKEMCTVKSMIERWKGATVYWDSPNFNTKNMAYVYKGVQFRPK